MRGLQIALALMLGLVATPARAQLDWFFLIHCTGVYHGADGENPQLEDSFGPQCHGEPGDRGSCSGTDEGDTSFSVVCFANIRPNGSIGETRCFAFITCPGSVGGEQRSCGGLGYTAFAGSRSFSGNGGRQGFIVCRPPGPGGGQEISFRCPEGLAIQ